MRIFRNWAITLFAASAIGVLTIGCNSGGSSSSTSSTGGTAETTGGTPSNPTGKKFKIGVSIPAADHGWTAGVVWWAKQEMDKHPEIEWTFATAENPDKQIKDLETMMVQGVDAVVVLATESAPLTPIAKQIHERKILLVNIDRGFTEPVADYFIEGDNKGFGKQSAEFMAKQLNGKGNIVILEGIPCTVNTDRVTAFRELMKGFPDIHILDSQPGLWNREKAMNVMQTLLVKNPQLDAVWASDDDMALGAEQAIKEAGRDKSMWILGGAGMKDIVKRVMDKDPMYPADITYPPSMITDGIKKAIEVLNGGKRDPNNPAPQEHITIPCELVLPDNAKDYYFPDSIY